LLFINQSNHPLFLTLSDHQALHLAAVLADAKSTQPESTILFGKLKDVSLMVAEELSLDSKPCLSGCLRGFTDDLLQLDREDAKHPREHNHVVPVRSVVNLVDENMIIKGVAT
jgi:hypothetical protein